MLKYRYRQIYLPTVGLNQTGTGCSDLVFVIAYNGRLGLQFPERLGLFE